jgi:SLT domain-containing protein
MPNELRDIINRLEKQKAAIDRALSALREIDDSSLGEMPISKRARRKSAANENPGRRTISDEGRARIAEAQRKRWAVKKRAVKKSASAVVKKKTAA